MLIGGNDGTNPILKYEYFHIDNLQWVNLNVESKFPAIPMNNINGFLIKRFAEEGCDAVIFSLTLSKVYFCA